MVLLIHSILHLLALIMSELLIFTFSVYNYLRLLHLWIQTHKNNVNLSYTKIYSWLLLRLYTFQPNLGCFIHNSFKNKYYGKENDEEIESHLFFFCFFLPTSATIPKPYFENLQDKQLHFWPYSCSHLQKSNCRNQQNEIFQKLLIFFIII